MFCELHLNFLKISEKRRKSSTRARGRRSVWRQWLRKGAWLQGKGQGRSLLAIVCPFPIPEIQAEDSSTVTVKSTSSGTRLPRLKSQSYYTVTLGKLLNLFPHLEHGDNKT